MTPFEYISVLISIVLGLGITQIVTGVAEMIHHSSKIKIYWPHVLWIILVFFLQVQEWWWLYELRNDFSWKLPVFLYVLLYPIDLFILSRILFCDLKDNVDYRDFYFSNYRKFFLLLAILAALAIVDDVLIRDYSVTDEILQLLLLIVSLTITIGKIRNEWVHKALVSIILIAVIIIAITANFI